MGLNPKIALDPFTQSVSKLLVDNGVFYLETTPYASGLKYTLWGANDFENRTRLEFPFSEYNGRLRIELPTDQSKFYKLQI